MTLYFHSDYPETLIGTLKKLHRLPGSDKAIQIVHREGKLEDFDMNETILFLMDSNSRGVSIPTKKHLESGYKVFVFRDTEENVNLFQLVITILSYWKKILSEIEKLNGPYMKTFSYKSRGFTSVKN